MFSRRRIALAAAVCFLGAAAAWAPANRHTTNKPIQHPVVLKEPLAIAAGIMVAASLFLSPLPSHAITSTENSVKVDVEGNSLVIKLDLPEFKANALREAFGAGKLKATTKEVPVPNDTTQKNEEQPTAAKEAPQPKVESSKGVENASEAKNGATSVVTKDESKDTKEGESSATPIVKTASEAKNHVAAQVKKDERESPVATTTTPGINKDESNTEKKEGNGVVVDGQEKTATKQAPVAVVETDKPKDEAKSTTKDEAVEQEKKETVKDKQTKDTIKQDSSDAERKDDAPTPLFQMIREAVMPEESKTTDQEEKRDDAAAPKQDKVASIVEKKQEETKTAVVEKEQVEELKAAQQPTQDKTQDQKSEPAPAPLLQMIREAVKPEETKTTEPSQQENKRDDVVDRKVAPKEEKFEAVAPVLEKKQQSTKVVEEPKAAEPPKEQVKTEETKSEPAPAPLLQMIREAVKSEETKTTEPSQQDSKRDDVVDSKIAPKEEKAEAVAPVLEKKQQPTKVVEELKEATEPPKEQVKTEETKPEPAPAPLSQMSREAVKPEEVTTTEPPRQEKRDDMQSTGVAKEEKVEVAAPVVEKKQEPTKVEELKATEMSKKESMVVIPEKQPEKEPVAEAPKVVVEQPKKDVVPDVAKEHSTPVPEAQKGRETPPPVVTIQKTEAQKETKEVDSSGAAVSKPAKVVSPPVTSDEDEIPILNRLWNDFASTRTESAGQASKTSFGDTPYWERPAFRIPLQKSMDGKGEILVLSNLDVARASAVGLGLASAANFMNLRPATRKQGGSEKETRKDNMKAERAATGNSPANPFVNRIQKKTDSDVVSNEVTLNKFAGRRKAAETSSRQRKKRPMPDSDPPYVAGSTGNTDPRSGTNSPNGGYLDALSGPRSSSDAPPTFTSNKGSGTPSYSDRASSEPYPASTTPDVQRSSDTNKSVKRKAPGIIYYSPEQNEAAARRASEIEDARRAAQSDDESRALYPDGFSNEVNGYNRKEPSIFPFPKDDRADTF